MSLSGQYRPLEGLPEDLLGGMLGLGHIKERGVVSVAIWLARKTATEEAQPARRVAVSAFRVK